MGQNLSWAVAVEAAMRSRAWSSEARSVRQNSWRVAGSQAANSASAGRWRGNKQQVVSRQDDVNANNRRPWRCRPWDVEQEGVVEKVTLVEGGEAQEIGPGPWLVTDPRRCQAMAVTLSRMVCVVVWRQSA